MGDILLYALIAAVAITGLVYGMPKAPKTSVFKPTPEPEPVKDAVMKEPVPSVVEESLEMMEERLKKLKSVDSEKPFAAISKPDIAEAPASVTEEAPISEVTVAPSTSPKKRNYRKKKKA